MPDPVTWTLSPTFRSAAVPSPVEVTVVASVVTTLVDVPSWPATVMVVPSIDSIVPNVPPPRPGKPPCPSAAAPLDPLAAVPLVAAAVSTVVVPDDAALMPMMAAAAMTTAPTPPMIQVLAVGPPGFASAAGWTGVAPGGCGGSVGGWFGMDS